MPSLSLRDVRYLSPFQVNALRQMYAIRKRQAALENLQIIRGSDGDLQAYASRLQKEIAVMVFGKEIDAEELMKQDEQDAINRTLEKRFGKSVGPLSDAALGAMGFVKVPPKKPPTK